MAIQNGFRANAENSVYLSGKTRYGRGSFLFFDAQASTDPLDDSAVRGLFVDSSDRLSYWNGTTTVRLSSGSGGTPTWEQIYAVDATFALTTATWTITQSAAADLLTLTKSNVGAGSVLAINNSGSGADVYGTAGTWQISAAGLAQFTTGSILGGTTKFGTGSADGTITSNGNYDLILKTGNATTMTMTFTDGANGDVDLALNGTGKLHVSGTTTHNDALLVAAGDVTITLGDFSITDDQNAESFSLVNNTATTIGNASSTGVVNIVSTSLTTGALVNLELTEGTLNGGWYLRCWDATAGAANFSVGEDGLVTILGNASGATNSLVITKGDVSMGDGSITMTDADDATSFSLTNDTAAGTAPMVLFTGSGTYTGVTTNSFVTITPSGLTTGTALYVAAGAATTASVLADFTTSTTTGTVLRLVATGVQLDGAATGVLTMVADSATTAGATAGRGLVSLSADALTTGTGLDVTSTSLGLAAGELANFEHIVSGTITAAKTGQLVDITSTRGHTGATAISDDYDVLSIIRSGTVNNAGGELNSAGSCLYILNTATQTAGAMVDSVNGVEISLQGGVEATGVGVKITHSGTTGGKALDIIASQTTGTVALITANSLTTTGIGLSIADTDAGMTSGSLLRISSGTTAAVATNGIVSLTATGAYTSTAVADGFLYVNAASTTAGTIQSIVGTGLTTGVGLYVASTGTGMTSGSLVRAVSGTTGAVATNGLLSVQATGAYTSTSNMGILSAIANATTAGTVAYLSATAMTTGTILFLNATAAQLTGKYIQCYDGAADDFSVGQYGATTIAGNASSTVLTIGAGNALISAGNLTFTAGTIITTPQAIVNANTAISITHGVTTIANNAPSTHTLADGTVGQKKTIICTVYTGDAVITPDNLANGTTITLNAANDAVDLVFLGTEWFATNLYGTAAVA